MTGWIADGSFGLVEQQIKGRQLVAAGAIGVIGYVSPNPGKNLTAGMLADYLDSGLAVGLVWEHSEESMLTENGRTVGQQVHAQAVALGYDVANCVMYAAADWNVQPSQLAIVNTFMAGFRQSFAHPGIYSNQRTLDMLAVTGNAGYFWQSNSKSYSNGTSTYAHLQQLYADPRAGSLPVDVNDIIRQPLGMMGGNMGVLQDDDRQFILTAIGAGAHAAATLTAQDEDGTKNRTVTILTAVQQLLQSAQAEQSVLQQIMAEAKAQGVELDYDKLAAAMAAHLVVQVSAK